MADFPLGADDPERLQQLYVNLSASAPVWQALDKPGVTTVIGQAMAGKSSLAQMIVRTPAPQGRRRLISARAYQDLQAAMAAARAELGGNTKPGDVLILDGLDELPVGPSPEEIHYGVSQSWLANARTIITRRPEPPVTFRSRSVLSVGGPPPTIAEYAGTYYWGDLVVLEWNEKELFEAVQKRLAASDQRLTWLALLAKTDFFTGSDAGPAKLAAMRHWLLAGQAPQRPPLLLTLDAANNFKLDLGIALADVTVDLQQPNGIIRANVLVPFTASRKLWIPEASELEAMINDSDVTEQDLQEFFAAHPHILSGAEYDRVVAHPYLERLDKGPLIPDFMLEPKGQLADILELKLPKAKIVANSKNRLRPAKAITEAKAQLREYRAWFDEPANRQKFRDRYGMDAYKPAAVVVVGRDPTAVDPYELRRLWAEEAGSVRVWTYDELLRRIRRLGSL